MKSSGSFGFSRASSFHSQSSRASLGSAASNSTFLSLISRSNSNMSLLNTSQRKEKSRKKDKTVEISEFEVNNGSFNGGEEFTVLNDASEHGAFGLGEIEADISRHENGYPLAMSHLCKIIKSTPQAIAVSGGRPLVRRGFVYMSNVRRHAKKKYMVLNNGKIRLFSLGPNVELEDYKDGDLISEIDLKKEYTYGIQRIQSIKYGSLKSKSFTLVISKPRKKKAMPLAAKGMLKTINRIRSMSQQTMGQKGRGSVNNDMFSDDGRSDRQSIRARGGKTGSFLSLNINKSIRDVLDKAKPGNKALQPVANTDGTSSTGKSSNRLGAAAARGNSMFRINFKKTKPKTKRKRDPNRSQTAIVNNNNRAVNVSGTLRFGTQISVRSNESFESFKSFSVYNNRNGTQASTKTENTKTYSVGSTGQKIDDSKISSLLLKDEAGNMVEAESSFVKLSFETVEQCHDWLKHLFVEIENQALLFNAYVEVVEKKIGQNLENLEIMLRKSIDLFTLARGVRNRKVWQMRERLALLLEDKGENEEAKLWYDMSHFLRSGENFYELLDNTSLKSGSAKERKKSGGSFKSLTSFGSITKLKGWRGNPKPKSKNEAFRNLVQFLEQYGRGEIIHRAEEAAQMYFDNYEIVEIAKRLEAEYARVPEGYEGYVLEAGKTPLETIQEQSEQLGVEEDMI